MPKMVGLGSLIVSSMLVAGQAVAQKPGESETLTLGVDRLFGINYSTDTAEQGGSEETTTMIKLGLLGSANTDSVAGLPRLSVDYFVVPGLSLGGSLMYLMLSPHTEVDGLDAPYDASASAIVVSPRVGYAAMLKESIGIWPRVGITYGYTWGEVDTTDATGAPTTIESSASTTLLDVEAMFILSPAPHVGLTLGPTFDMQLGRMEKRADQDQLAGVSTTFTNIGLQAGLLAWL